jgi:cytochrome b561
MFMNVPNTYSRTARLLHWSVAAFILVLVPVGFLMGRIGSTPWTGTLYSSHKLAGFLVLWLVILRLAYRLLKGAPTAAKSLKPWEITVSSSVHWALYVLLLIVPLLGWMGTSAFGALTVYGVFSLPAVTGIDKDAAKLWLLWHGWLAIGLSILMALHIGAALNHALIRKDGVFHRMWG